MFYTRKNNFKKLEKKELNKVIIIYLKNKSTLCNEEKFI